MPKRKAKRGKGIVKWYSWRKAYGFITPFDGGEDLFVHETSIQKHSLVLRKGEAVRFKIEQGEDGRLQAGEVNTWCYAPLHLTMCYSCEEFGHVASDCPTNPLKCQRCGQEGHVSRDCKYDEFGRLIEESSSGEREDSEFTLQRSCKPDTQKIASSPVDPRGEIYCQRSCKSEIEVTTSSPVDPRGQTEDSQRSCESETKETASSPVDPRGETEESQISSESEEEETASSPVDPRGETEESQISSESEEEETQISSESEEEETASSPVDPRDFLLVLEDDATAVENSTEAVKQCVISKVSEEVSADVSRFGLSPEFEILLSKYESQFGGIFINPPSEDMDDLITPMVTSLMRVVSEFCNSSFESISDQKIFSWRKRLRLSKEMGLNVDNLVEKVDEAERLLSSRQEELDDIDASLVLTRRDIKTLTDEARVLLSQFYVVMEKVKDAQSEVARLETCKNVPFPLLFD